MTKVLVCGGRDFNNAPLLKQALDAVHSKQNISTIISGMAKGADTLAVHWANFMGIPVDKYPADWNTYKKSAGMIRNRQMLVEGKPDLVVAFRGGDGTENMITQALKAGIPVIKIP